MFSLKLQDKYSYHWERRNLDGTIFRQVNAFHLEWKDLPTCPEHLHNGSEDEVESIVISDDYEKAVSDFLTFIRNSITKS